MSGVKPVDNKHFLIHGEVMYMDMEAGKEMPAEAALVTVIQDGEIYVAFNADEKGKYLFNLPINHTYEVFYGGNKYVNKSIAIDARNLSKKKIGHTVELNMGLFDHYAGVDYSFLQAPIAVFYFEPEFDQLIPDEVYSRKAGKQMNKCYKQIAKLQFD
jgi:hypothetical protein